MRAHAFAGDPESLGLRAQLPGAREASLHLGLAGRSGTGRSGAHSRSALERRSGLGRRRQAHAREVRLPPRGGQPDGPDPRDLRPRRQHRPRSGGRGTVRGDQHRALGDGHALDARHRSAAVLGRAAAQAGPGRPLADHPLRAAVHRHHRRRRGARGHRRAAGRSLAGRQRLRAQHHHARDRDVVPLLLGVLSQLPHPRAGHHAEAARRRRARVRRGRGDPRGAAAGDPRPPRQGVLQPQHRCRADVGAAHHRADDRAGARDRRRRPRRG